MCATCYRYVLNRCILLASKARESNFYTTPRRIVVSESFLPLARIVYEEMVRGKGWTALPLCRKTRRIYLAVREWKATREKAEARLHCRLAGLRLQEMSAYRRSPQPSPSRVPWLRCPPAPDAVAWLTSRRLTTAVTPATEATADRSFSTSCAAMEPLSVTRP